jgi:predicted O-methyltransferase YrrM
MNITNEIISAYIDNLYVNENTDLAELREFAETNNIPVIRRDTEKLLKVIMKLKQPARVLEIGTAVGYSSCVFADCCGCSVLSIELEEESAIVARSNIENLGFSGQVKVVCGEAGAVLRGLDPAAPYDLLFIDAAKSHYREFWDLAMPYMSRESIVICDNVLLKGMTASDECVTRRRDWTSTRRMREFIEYITSLDYADTTIVPIGDGLSISIIDKNGSIT